jgi:hypothetical protein
MKHVLTSASAAERQLTDVVSSIAVTTTQLRSCCTRHQLRRLHRLRRFATHMLEQIGARPLEKKGDAYQ